MREVEERPVRNPRLLGELAWVSSPSVLETG